MSDKATALVLAASRSGADDPVAAVAGKTHKCLVKVAGTSMIERVVGAVIESHACDRILVCIESEDVLREVPRLAAWLDEGIVAVTPSRANLTDSVLALADEDDPPVPLFVTTADNVLHTPELVADFVRRGLECDTDIAIGYTREETVRAEFPDEPLGFFRFRDGGRSFCNLFLIRTPESFEGAEVFRSGGQFRKKPWRILQAFGLFNLLLFRLGVATLEGSLRRVSRRLGIRLQAVEVPWPFAPIDVDNPRTLELSERILRARRGAQ